MPFFATRYREFWPKNEKEYWGGGQKICQKIGVYGCLELIVEFSPKSGILDILYNYVIKIRKIMEKIAENFKGKGEVSGVMFYQLFRHEKLCLYLRIDPDNFVSYEVIKLNEHKAGTANFGGVKVEYAAKESYPKSDRWGTTERGSTSLSKAINYYNQFAAELKYTIPHH